MIWTVRFEAFDESLCNGTTRIFRGEVGWLLVHFIVNVAEEIANVTWNVLDQVQYRVHLQQLNKVKKYSVNP